MLRNENIFQKLRHSSYEQTNHDKTHQSHYEDSSAWKGSDGWSVGNAVSDEDADSVHVNLRF